jgi:hypothetical protein
MTDQCSPGHHSRTTSPGVDLSESSYFDAHFEAMQPEYETMICSIGIKQGCGGGSFLPLLTELVGEGGHISVDRI